MHRIAVIDLGTNTFNLLIAELNGNGGFKNIHQDRISVKLGEGGLDKGFISEAAFKRGLEALKKYRITLIKYGVSRVKAFATSAIRSTSNGTEFVNQVKRSIGIEIEIINGDREAELIYKGCKLAYEFGKNYELILDIGGGSNEFIICNEDGMVWKQSFPLGVSRMKEQFKPSDPIRSDEIELLENYFKKELSPLFDALLKWPCSTVVGCSGSFETYADMICKQQGVPCHTDENTIYLFDMEEYKKIHAFLIDSNLEERLKTPGIIEMRADMIVIGTIFTMFILNQLNLQQMKLCHYALKEGVIYEELNR